METDTSSASDEMKQALETVKTGNVLFAHKSVGNNMLSGINTVAKDNKVALPVRKIDKAPAQEQQGITHSTGGENYKPISKIDAFNNQIKGLDRFKPQVAMMKLCFLDITQQTDVDAIFNYYKNTLNKLKQEQPDITFAHLTVPLTARSYKMKDRVKRLIGKTAWDDASNQKRAAFNKMLKETFADDPIFDIARVESTRPDGSREEFKDNGKTYYGMTPVYAIDDGSHLNEYGQRKVAEKFIPFLAEVLNKKQQNQ